MSAKPGDEPRNEPPEPPDTSRQVSEPTTVDLRRLPPSPVESGEPKVAPAPGVPNPLPMLVRDVKLDLGRRLQLDIGDIELVNADEVTWPDASLGCPTPGASYAQVLTPGYRIVLLAKGREYRYHTQGTASFILCDQQ